MSDVSKGLDENIIDLKSLHIYAECIPFRAVLTKTG